MSATPVRCLLVIMYPKPKVTRGRYFPEDHCGTYGARNRNSFAIPIDVKPVVPEEVTDNEAKKTKPLFVLDPSTGLCQPVGKAHLAIVEKWAKFNDDGTPKASLQQALELAMQKRYVKEMAKHTRDLVEMLIIGAAGLGIGLFVLHLIGVFTGNQLTI